MFRLGKYCMTISLLIGIILLCGCSKSKLDTNVNPSITPVTGDSSNNVLTEVPDSVTATPAITHLELYEDFDMYNSKWDYFKGFILSEVLIDGAPYYQLLCEDKDVKIIVNQNQNQSVIYHNGKQMEYEMSFLKGANAITTIDLLDLTGDDREELIICHTMSGTGVMAGTCDVINIDDMTIYPINKFIYDLSSCVIVEPIEIMEEHNILCKITDTNGKVYNGTVTGESDNINDYSYIPSDNNGYYSIEVDCNKKKLRVHIGLSIEGGFVADYLGGINSFLTYNKDKNCFELSNDYEIEITNPAIVK